MVTLTGSPATATLASLTRVTHLPDTTLHTIAHVTLRPEHLGGLRRLFDAEYLASHGTWDPDLPYGYAGHDVHVLALRDREAHGHAGWARRAIQAGEVTVTVAGTGGVLVSPDARGVGLGRRIMDRVADSMRGTPDVEFGYLGCREEVAPFYESCGWQRISAAEQYIARDGRPTTQPPGPPLMVLPLRPGVSWPDGPIDLRGRCW